MTAFKAELK